MITHQVEATRSQATTWQPPPEMKVGQVQTMELRINQKHPNATTELVLHSSRSYLFFQRSISAMGLG